METHHSKFAAVGWEDPASSTIIRLTLRQRWSLEHILEAKAQLADLIDQRLQPIGLIVYWENPNRMPPYFNQIITELTTDLHPNIEYIVFVGKDPIVETAYQLAARPASHLMYQETIEAAREYLWSMLVAQSG